MGEVPQWPPSYFSSDAEQQGDQHGIVVRNTFIDVRHEESDDDPAAGSISPHRRNLSAPPSPSRVHRPRDPNFWGKDVGLEEQDEQEDEPGGIPSYHWRPELNLFFQDQRSAPPAPPAPPNSEQQVHGSADWPDQYIEDCPPAYKFEHEAPPFSGAPGSGPRPPGLLLSSGEQRDGKGGYKGPAQAPAGFKGAQRPRLGSFLRSAEGDVNVGGGFDNGGAEQGFVPGKGVYFSYATGFRGGGMDGGSLGMDAGPMLGGPPLAPRGRESAGRHGHPQSGFLLEQPGGSMRDAARTLGPFGALGQDIWHEGSPWRSDTCNRWVDNSGHQDGQSGPALGGGMMPPWYGIGMPAPPLESSLGPGKGDGFGGEAALGAQQQHGQGQHGQGGNRKQRRGHTVPQWSSDQGGWDGQYNSEGRGPTGAGLGIAAGAAAVGPVVGAGHRERGPFAQNTGPAPGAGGRGAGGEHLAVGSAAMGSAAAGLPSSSGAGPFPNSSGMMAGAQGSAPGHPSGGAPGAANFGKGGAASSPSQGQQGHVGKSQTRMVNAGKGGHGPWIPEGIDIAAAVAAAASQNQGQDRDRGGRGKGEEAKGGAAAASGGLPNRMPLSGGGPKRTDYLRKYGENEGNNAVQITTMMLKNIPCRKTQEEVMEHIDSKNFVHRYDFFYLPRDVKFRANLGYAFINFVTPEDAAAFQAEMNGYRFANSGSSKACAVVPAHVQGLVNNLAAFKRTEVMRSSRKPYFSGGVVAL